MKRALCVNSIENISDLIYNKSDIIDSSFVPRDICEDPNNKFLQVIPYVTFYCSDSKEGNIIFVQYRRASSGGDERLLSKTSIGIGGHIDQLTDVVYATASSTEDGGEHFTMTKEDMFDTIVLAAKRECLEELGVDVFETLGVNFDINDSAFFTGDQNEEVNLVHIGVSIPVKLTNVQLNKFFEVVQIDKTEVEVIDKMTLATRLIVEGMDITVTVNKIIQELKEKHNLEDWSCKVFEYITRKEIGHIFKNVTYDDLYSLALEKAKVKE